MSFTERGIGRGGAKAPNVHDGKSSMGVSQDHLLRIEAKDTCIILAIILLGIGPPFEITANVHIEYIVKKANRRLYALRTLKKSNLTTMQLVQVYCSILRSVLAYACPAEVLRERYRICAKKGLTHRSTELSL